MSQIDHETLNIFVDEAGDPTLFGNRKCWRADRNSNTAKACRVRLMCTSSPANGEGSKIALEAV